MRLFVARVVWVLLALSFTGIDSKLDKFTQCNEFFFNGKPPVIPNWNNYKTICQKYKNQFRYATLYDTARRIPLFSAYKYTETTEFKIPQISWMAEIQLEPFASEKNEPFTAEMREPFVKQARNLDYMRNNANNYITGALFPTSHTADKETARSTLTLTNIFPLNKKFNENIWNLVETEMKNNMDSKCLDINNNVLAYVVTGVIPGDEKLNERVNVPSFVWTAFCCYDSSAKVWVSDTYYATNKRPKNEKIVWQNLVELNTFLNEGLGGEVIVFHENCHQN